MTTPVDENVDDLIDRLRKNYNLDLTDVRNKKQLGKKILDMDDGEIDATDALKRKKNLVKGYLEDMWSSDEVNKFVQFNKDIEKVIEVAVAKEVPDVGDDIPILTEKKLEKIRELIEEEEDINVLRTAARKATTSEEIGIINERLKELGKEAASFYIQRVREATTKTEVREIIRDIRESALKESTKEGLIEGAEDVLEDLE